MRWLHRLPPVPLSLPLLVGLLVAASLLAHPLWNALPRHRHRPLPIHVEVIATDASLSPSETSALAHLFHVWAAGHPGLTPSGAPDPDALVVRVQARREGSRLRLRLDWHRGRAQATEADGHLDGAPLSPAESLDLLGRIPGLPAGEGPSNLAFRAPEDFWQWVSLEALHRDRDPSLTLLPQARDLLGRFPSNPLARLTCARLLQDHALHRPDQGSIDGDSPAHTCLDDVPPALQMHPCVLAEKARILSDQGAHVQALSLLQPLLQGGHPPVCVRAIAAYVASEAGHLDYARQWSLNLPPQWALPLHLLYEGTPAAFLDQRRSPNVTASPAEQCFYEGYAAHLAGRTHQAREAMRAATQCPEGSPYPALAQLFLDLLQGDETQARALLQSGLQKRVGHDVPGGRITFHLAEAASRLGDETLALEAAHRAYAQGFACTPWYLGSPWLAPLQGSRAFQSLCQRLAARQRLLEVQFPARQP